MQLNCKELECSECCKKYYITVLPQELSKEATFLGVSEQEFVKRYCQLYIQLFPRKGPAELVVFGSLLPKRIAEKMKKALAFMPSYFLVLPLIAFKRNKNKCIFLEKTGSCEIYKVKPRQCVLFPFISLNKNEKNFKKLYPFCKALQKNDFSNQKNLGERHYEELKNYFQEIKEKGFSKIWRHWPRQGILLFENRIVSKISLNEFRQLVQVL